MFGRITLYNERMNFLSWLVKFKNLHPKCTFNVVYRWIRDINGEKWPLPDSPTCQAIVRSIDRLPLRFSKLKKQHNSSERKWL